MENPLTEQIKFGSAISLPLDQLETGNLAFCLTLRPRQIQTRPNGDFISPKSPGKASEFRGLAFQRIFHPRGELGGRVVSDQANKGLGEVIEFAQFTVCLSQEQELVLLFLGKSVHWQAEPPSDLSWGRDSCFQGRWPGPHHRASR